MARVVAEVHTVLRKQFGFIAADQFQVHATLKGFFKRIDGPLTPMVEHLDNVFATTQPFTVHFCGYHSDEGGIGLDVSRRHGQKNADLFDIRERIVQAVLPNIASDCDFVEKDLAPPFKAHITLAFRDISAAMHADVLDYLAEVALPTQPFLATRFHLVEFFSREWSADWEQTLTWRIHKTWRLSAA